MIQSNDHERQVEEIRVSVPWGHLACKWWGSKSVRPILCIHGWQDNSASFDPLIIRLPDHVSYLAIDLPGHGRSSHIGDGMIYSIEIFFYSIMLICDYFRWEKVSLMAHSLGSILSFLYASTFPNKCDMVIGLDTLRPYGNIYKLIQRHFAMGLQRNHEADARNRQLLVRIKSGIFMMITDESATYLLSRSVLPSEIHPHKYYFSRDSRLKASTIPMMEHAVVKMFAKNITSPYCYLKSSARSTVDNDEYHNEMVAIMRENPNFEMHSVGGDHHVHINEPDRVSGIISAFIDKYRPRRVPSRL